MSRRARIIAVIALSLIGVYLLVLARFFILIHLEQRAHIRWEYPLVQAHDLSPDVLSDGTIVCSAEGAINWISPTGKLRASFAHNTMAYGETAWAAGAGDLLYLALPTPGVDGGLYNGPSILCALNKDAKRVWEARLPECAKPSAAFQKSAKTGLRIRWIWFSKDIVYCLLDEGWIWSLDLQGHTRWCKQTKASAYSVLGVDDQSRVYFCDDQYEFIAWDKDAKELWSLRLAAVVSSFPAFAPDGTAYPLDSSGVLSAISPEGQLRWQYSPPPLQQSGLGMLFPFGYSGQYWGGWGNSNNRFPEVGLDGTLYFSDEYGMLYAVKPDGTLRWQKRTGGVCIHPLVGQDGTIYACCQGVGVIAYTPSGRVKWRNRGLKGIQSAPQSGPDGVFYVEAGNILYAMDP